MDQEKNRQSIVELLGSFQARTQPGDGAAEMDLLQQQIKAIKAGEPGSERGPGGAVKSFPAEPDFGAITKWVCCP